MHKPESVFKKEAHKTLWDSDSNGEPNQIVNNMLDSGFCCSTANPRVDMKENEQVNKYLYLA